VPSSQQVRKHHRDLTALSAFLGGSFGLRENVWCPCFRIRASAQSSDGVEQLSAVPDNANAKILQVFGRQVQQDRVVDCILAERRLILSKA
jgi:hypothetical protein